MNVGCIYDHHFLSHKTTGRNELKIGDMRHLINLKNRLGFQSYLAYSSGFHHFFDDSEDEKGSFYSLLKDFSWFKVLKF